MTNWFGELHSIQVSRCSHLSYVFKPSPSLPPLPYWKWYWLPLLTAPQGIFKQNKNFEVTNFRRKRLAHLSHWLQEHWCSLYHLLPLLLLLLTVAFWCSRANGCFCQPGVMPTPNVAQSSVWQPLSYETGASILLTTCLAPRPFPSLGWEPFLPQVRPGKPSEMGSGARHLPNKIIVYFSVLPQGCTATHPASTISLFSTGSTITPLPFYSIGHWGMIGGFRHSTQRTAQVASPFWPWNMNIAGFLLSM